MRTPSIRAIRNVTAGGLSAALLVGTFLTPAGAHYNDQSDAHVFNTHVKALADARYDRLSAGDHVKTTYLTIANAVQFSNVSSSPQALGGFQFDVAPGQSRTAIVTFSAESACFGVASYCVVDIILDSGAGTGVPNSGGDFAFDSSNNNNETSSSWESHSMTRAFENLAPGTHTIDIVGYVQSASLSFRIDDAFARLDIIRV